MNDTGHRCAIFKTNKCPNDLTTFCAPGDDILHEEDIERFFPSNKDHLTNRIDSINEPTNQKSSESSFFETTEPQCTDKPRTMKVKLNPSTMNTPTNLKRRTVTINVKSKGGSRIFHTLVKILVMHKFS